MGYERGTVKSFREARAMQRCNPAAHWHLPGQRPDDPNGTLAFQRLNRRIFEPYIKPRFKVRRDSSFFMIGSCFARGLEAALSHAGCDVRSFSKAFDRFETIRPGVTPRGAMNRYNTASVLNEFRWALDPKSPFPAEALVDIDDERCIDPHMTPTLKLADRRVTFERREIYTEILRQIRCVDVIVITLGLVEVWVDTRLGIVINGTPDPHAVGKDPMRFQFRKLSFAENLDNLRMIRQLLSTTAKAGHKIIVTTSPVALAATFTEQDVVVANTYSKSVLRAVATEFAEEHDNVDYFPSYEIVMYSDDDIAWLEDRRHVQGTLAQHIMRRFAAHYVEDHIGHETLRASDQDVR